MFTAFRLRSELSRSTLLKSRSERTRYSTVMKKINIQNFAARLLATYHHHSTSLLENRIWLPIPERIKYKVASNSMCFNVINGFGPATVFTPSRALRSSSDTCVLKIEQYKRKTCGFAFSVALDSTYGIHSHKTSDTALPCHLWKPI